MKSETKFRDVLALNIWANLRSKVSWFSIIIFGFIVSLGTVYPVLPSEQHIALDALMLIAGFGTGAILIILISIPLVAVIAMSNFLKKGNIGTRNYSVNDQFFTEDDGYKVTNVPWKDIKGIYKTPRYIFVKITRFKYAIISRRDFTNEYEFVSYYTNLIKLLSSYT